MSLDDVIARPRYVMRQSRLVGAAPELVWAELTRVTMAALPLSYALESLRYLPARLAGRPCPPLAPRTFLDVTPIPVLSAEPPTVLVAAGLSQAWRLLGGRTPPDLDAAGLRAWAAPGWIKVGMEYRLLPAGAGTRASIETRIAATDPATQRAFAAYWLAIRPGSAAIRREVLRVVARRAEAIPLAEARRASWRR